jgi:ATP-dependent protease HslVU (ClpYQ) peptidase subunit
MERFTHENTDRNLRQLEGRIAHQKLLAAQLAHHGFKGAAADALALLATLQDRLSDKRRPI